MAHSVTQKVEFIRSVFGQVHIGRDGINVAVKCPACPLRDVTKLSTTKKKLIIRIDDDRAHCWVCGLSARSLAPLISRFGTQEQLKEYREKFRAEAARDPSSSVFERQHVDLPRDFRLITLASRTDPDAVAVRRYVERRGLADDTMWRYMLGVSDEPKWYRRVIVPSFDGSGHLNYVVGRAVDRSEMRYTNCDGVPKTDVVFNEISIDWSEELVVCEGPFDMFKCGDNATCLLGSELNEGHVLFDRITLHSTPVVLALDDDMGDKIDSIARVLTGYNVRVRVADLAGRHDPGSMTSSEFAAARRSAHEWSWRESALRRLQERAARI